MKTQPHHKEQPVKSNEVINDIVIGMSDGLAVPFVLTAGLSGAIDSTTIIVIAGISAIAAGSIAMGFGGYLTGKTETDNYQTGLRRKYDEGEKLPHREEQEVKDFFANLGLSESMQQQATEEVIKDKENWVEFKVKHELGLQKTDPKRAIKSGLTIGLSYVVGGLVPVCSYFFIEDPIVALKYSAIATLACLFIFGWLKSRLTGGNPLLEAFRVAIIGALAAGSAFFVASLFD